MYMWFWYTLQIQQKKLQLMKKKVMYTTQIMFLLAFST